LGSERLAAILFICLAMGGLPATGQDMPSSEPPSPGPDLSRFLPHEDLDRDGRRTLGAFPKNLGRSFVGVFSRDNLSPFLAGAAASGAAFLVDAHTQASLGGQAPGLSQAASTAGGGRYMIPATVGLFVAGRFAEGSRFRAFSYDATQAIIVNGVYTEALKRAVGRTRPDGSDQRSFPSGHASTAFAWATVAQAHYGWKVGAPSYLAATAIGFSRITNNKHNLSDVVAGATIGIITGRTVVRTNGDPVGRKRTFTLHPMTDANGTGVGLGASFSW
jgi:membrane-associated phospholipid phosphatase